MSDDVADQLERARTANRRVVHNPRSASILPTELFDDVKRQAILGEDMAAVSQSQDLSIEASLRMRADQAAMWRWVAVAALFAAGAAGWASTALAGVALLWWTR